MSKDLTFTTIEESARQVLGISRDEYAACNYIQVWSSYPSNKNPGFCDRTKQQMADFIGITTRGVLKMLTRLQALELVERYSETRFLYRITPRWFEVVTLAKEQRKGEQSSPFMVNKVPLYGEQSSSFGVNKVPLHKEFNKDNKEINKEVADALPASESDYQKIGELTLEPDPSKKIAPGAGGATLRITMLDPELPGMKVLDKVPTAPTVMPTSTGRVPRKRSDTQEEIDFAADIISYLNKTAGREFRLNTNNNAKGIIARRREGFTADDMRRVVDFKTAEWKSDPKFFQYLCPDTLFCPKNFEKYLQAAKVNAPKQQGQPAQKTTFSRQETFYEPSPYKKF